MKVQCPGCRSTIAIPDEKIPEGKAIRVLCPKCKNPIQVSRGGGEPEHRHDDHNGVEKQAQPAPSPSPPSFSPPPSSPTPSAAASESAGMRDMSNIDMVEEGVEKALLYVSNASSLQKIEQALQQMDYYVSAVPTAQHAIGKLSNNPYDLVVTDEIFEKKDEESESFLDYLLSMNMYTRRQFLLCLVNDKLKTLDHLTAFRFGVNLILNSQDLDKTRLILERAVREHKTLYRVFNNELKKKQE